MAQKPIFKLVGTIAGQIVYYSLLSYAWMLLGWNAHFLGWIATVVACIVNPLLCAYIATLVSHVQKKIYAVVVWLVLLPIVLVCAPTSNIIWMHASGYYRYLTVPTLKAFFGETVAVNQFVDIIGMVISGILFVVCFAVLKARKKNQTLRD